jgi:SAM-dependent methyltransferase
MGALRSRLAAVLPPRVRHRLWDVYTRVVTAYRLITRHRSRFVSSYLTGLKGIEIGAGSHNRFYLDAINVDRFGESDTAYKREERRLARRAAKVDVVSPGDCLPFDDQSYDFVFSSHVIEHFPDPIKALREWVRVARRYVVVVAPHRDRTFDAGRPLSTVAELMERNRSGFSSEEDRHWSVWTCESFVDMCEAAGLHVIDHQDPDDKVGNGFIVAIDAEKSRPGSAILSHAERESPAPGAATPEVSRRP